MLEDDPQRLAELQALAARLSLPMADMALMDRALTHASTSGDVGGPTYDYESLEFLGDAALGLAIADHLFRHVPDRTPGEYSRMRAALVNRRCLARVAQQLDIAPAIRLGRGEELAGGRHRAALLADCLEALIGALYFTCGMEPVYAFVVEIFQDEIREASALEKVWDFKSRLQHYCQAERIPLPDFNLVRAEGPDHSREFEVEAVLSGKPAGRGTGLSKKEAEQRASRAALESVGHRFDDNDRE
jgi:ribonuclease-3